MVMEVPRISLYLLAQPVGLMQELRKSQHVICKMHPRTPKLSLLKVPPGSAEVYTQQYVVYLAEDTSGTVRSQALRANLDLNGSPVGYRVSVLISS